jgi:hypothetical protein
VKKPQGILGVKGQAVGHKILLRTCMCIFSSLALDVEVTIYA